MQAALAVESAHPPIQINTHPNVGFEILISELIHLAWSFSKPQTRSPTNISVNRPYLHSMTEIRQQKYSASPI